MKYWWVNHKQTHSAEINGGYLWAPKVNKNNSKNQSYLNMTLTTPGDWVFSFAGAEIKAIGIVDNICLEKSKPKEFGKAGESWADVGWLVSVDWQVLRKPFRPKAHIAQLIPFLPSKYSPIQENGNGNQSCYLAEVSSELAELLNKLSIQYENDLGGMLKVLSTKLVEDVEVQKLESNAEIEVTEISQLVKARVGQGRFRINVEKVETACRLTGITQKQFLIASHIKPWRYSDNKERLDGHNGLLLSPHVDKLFDGGWVTFENDGSLKIANDEVKKLMLSWGLNLEADIGTFTARQKEYLKFHRSEIFDKK